MQYNFDEVINRAHTNCMKYDGRKMIFGTEDLLPMWVADMDFKTPDCVTKAVKERASHEIYGYPYKPASYFDSIQYWMQTRHNWETDRDWLTFSPGVVPGLAMAVLATTQPGDKIIAQTPVYFPFFEVIQGLGRELVINELVYEDGRYRMNFEELENLIDNKTRALMFCSPHNPVGRVWENDELQKLADLAVANNMYIISDDIHADLVLPGATPHTPIATLSEEIARHTVTTMAPSKTFNMAGLSASVVIIPDPHIREKYLEYMKALHLGMGNIFGLAGLEAAYKNGHEWLDQMLTYIKANLNWMTHEIHSQLPDVTVVQPEATYLAWIDFRALGMSDAELQQFFTHKAKLGLNNGARFGKGGEGFMRINFAAPRSIVEEGTKRMIEAVKTL